MRVNVPRNRIRALLILAVTSGVMVRETWAQKVDTIALPAATGVFRSHEGFTAVASIRELNDGRVLVTEPHLHRLSVVDFTRSSVIAVGRKGQGPGEYNEPGALYALAGDSTLLTDFSNWRWYVMRGAEIVATLPPTGPAAGRLGPNLSGADTTGRVVGVEGYGYTHVPVVGGRETADSLRVYLVENALSGSPRMDTIGRLGGRGRFGVDIIRHPPYVAIRPNVAGSEDQALLFPDRWVAFAYNDPYRVEWRRPDGRKVSGQALPIAPVRITEKEVCAIMRRGNAEADCTRLTVPDMPKLLPAFFDKALVAAPSGELLIKRAPSTASHSTYYDVVDRTGALRRVIRLGLNQSIIGSGARSVYVITEDDVGLQWLTRHPWLGS